MNPAILIISFVFFVTVEGFARIKNGYSRQIQPTRSALRNLKFQLTTRTDISPGERRRLEANIQGLITFISCYELTDELISRMKIISPAIYWDIENIKDKKGRSTDVYIRLVPAEKARVNLKAASFLSQAVDDKDASRSEYGPFTVSIDVCISDNSLFLLSHEFGHIKYIIPNLASYKQFYRNAYGLASVNNLSYIGHNHRDESGRIARQFERIYRENQATYRRNLGSDLLGFVSLYSRLKKMHRDMDTHHDSALAHLF
jgi:hypothetical protein